MLTMLVHWLNEYAHSYTDVEKYKPIAEVDAITTQIDTRKHDASK